ncbi:OmpH family outer membrane protein [Candidatus Dependentiae bacterium]|nr:OmpH family outer membrane protein [Candidatus Dependentiae bacterium]
MKFQKIVLFSLLSTLIGSNSLQTEPSKMLTSIGSNSLQTEPSKSDARKTTIIVVISGQTLVQKSKFGQTTQKELERKQQELSKQLQEDEKIVRKKEQELQEKKRALDKEAEEIASSKLLSQDGKQRKYEELQDRVRSLEEDKSELDRLIKRLQADAKRVEAKMAQFYQEEMTKLDQKIRKTIQQVARREGWDIVFMEESGIIYASEEVTKTEVMLRELDAAYEKEERTKKDDAALKNSKKN